MEGQRIAHLSDARRRGDLEPRRIQEHYAELLRRITEFAFKEGEHAA